MPARLRSLLSATLLVLTLMFMWTASVHAQTYLYDVSVPTDELNAPENSGDAPFSLYFDLSAPSGPYGNNTVTITNFNVTGPSSPVILTDTGFDVNDEEPFTAQGSPDSTLTFTVATTNNPDTGGGPDEFSFFILNNGGFAIPTTDTESSSLFYINLGGATPSVTTFQGMGTYAGVNPTVTLEGVVPEPSPATVLIVAFIGLAGLFAIRKRARANS